MAAALGDGAEETTAGGKILLVGGEVRGEVKDALSQGCGLIIGTASVLVVELVVLEIDIRVYGDAAHCIVVILKFPAAGVDSYRPFPPFGKEGTVPHSPVGATGITGIRAALSAEKWIGRQCLRCFPPECNLGQGTSQIGKIPFFLSGLRREMSFSSG
jgi:hypothetical protein